MTTNDKTRRGVGRPRDPRLDPAILAVTIDLLSQADGLDAVTLDDIAARAGVGKASIYRRWSAKEDLILDAVRADLPLTFDMTDHDGLESDARALLASLVQVLGTRAALAGRQLLPLLQSWPQLAQTYRDGVLTPWRTALHTLAARARTRGEVDDPSGTRTALQAAASALTVEWLVDPAGFDVDLLHEGGVDRVGELVDVLLRPPVITRTPRPPR